MKQTVNLNDFRQAFSDYNREENFSYEAQTALFDYLEQFEDDCGEEIELDIIGLCCDYSEYESAIDAATEYGFKFDGDPDNDEALDFLRENTSVIEFNSGIVIQSF